jgi:hypothetical protein
VRRQEKARRGASGRQESQEMGFGVKTMSVSPAFVPDAGHPAPEPFGYRPLAAIAAAAAGGVPQKRIGRVLSEMAPALVALHAQGKVHGAISVHTVGLDEFGHAHLMVPALYPDHPGSMEPASCFAAVEQFDADPIVACGPWTDVYAVCAVMCSLISGSPPPHALARRAQDQYVPLAARAPRGYEPAFLATVDRGLSLVPAQRPPSVQALCDILGVSYLAEAQADAPADHRPGAPAAGAATGLAQRAGNRRRRLAGVFAVAAGVLAVAGVWAWLGQRDVHDEVMGPVVVASHSSAGHAAPPPYAPARPGKPVPPAQGNGGIDSVRPGAGPLDRAPQALSTPTPASSPAQNTLGESPLAPAPSVGREASAALPDTASPAAEAPARPARVTVKVDVQPWGEVFVDGVSRGVSPPLKTLSLPAGRHTVEVRNADLPPYRMALDLKPGQPLTLRHVFR